MHGPNGGWILLQERSNVTFNFTRNWVSYENGFGQPGFGLWLGNSFMHALTFNRRYVLRIDIPNFMNGYSLFGEYDNFQVSGPSTNYILRVGNFRGNMRNILLAVNNSAFSTWDRDNDKADEECAKIKKGGWWYKDRCKIAVPNEMVRFVKTSLKAKEVLGGNLSLNTAVARHSDAQMRKGVRHKMIHCDFETPRWQNIG